MRRRYIVTIITALVIAGYLSFDEKQENQQIAVEAIKSEPDYLITGLSIESYTENGTLSQQIDADKATHYPHNNSIDFEQPKVILRQGNSPQWGITSKTGQLIGDETLQLNGNIQIVPLQDSVGIFSLSTEALTIDLLKHIADTDAQVIIESNSTKLKAIGMNMNLNSQLTVFKSQVRGIHDPNVK